MWSVTHTLCFGPCLGFLDDQSSQRNIPEEMGAGEAQGLFQSLKISPGLRVVWFIPHAGPMCHKLYPTRKISISPGSGIGVDALAVAALKIRNQ